MRGVRRLRVRWEELRSQCAHGPRVYGWVSAPIRATFPRGPRGRVLARRNITTGETAYYVCFVGARAVEDSFQTAKKEVGLDQYQARRRVEVDEL